jgi:hypothetical protein
MPKIGRPRAEVVVTDDERAALVRLMKRVRVNRAVAFRARMVLACIDASDTAVARRLRTTKMTVAKWRSQECSAYGRSIQFPKCVLSSSRKRVNAQ